MTTPQNDPRRETESWPRLVGGDPVLDFVNTEIVTGGSADEDVLRSATEFRAWCAFAGILPPTATETHLTSADERSLLSDAAALRSAVRSIVETLGAGLDAQRGARTTDAWATLQALDAEAITHAEPLFESGRLRWHWEPAPRAALWVMANSAVDLLRGDSVHRLKACPGCGFVFLDETRNGSRRWCAMEDCGTREKVQRYVTKRAAARPSA
jgi:predicted RNA-binding Zn ribbon-like protein